MDEVWKDIPNYEGLYEVSNCGIVRSLNYNHTGKTKVMKALKNRNGYLRVNLWKDGKRKAHLVHRLVWEAFRGAIPAGLQINHLDERKDNNWLDNLEVCTHKENINHGTRNERVAKALIGKNVNNPSQSKPVHQIDIVSGEILNTYSSCMEAQRQTGIHQTEIVQCCKGKRYKSAGGFKWRYAND